MSTEHLTKLYDHRFSERDRARKNKVWEVLCRHFFQRFVQPTDTVLDIACGQGEFIRHIHCRHKIAVDLNPQVADNLPPEIRFLHTRADAMTDVASESVDVAFASNFFEHLESKRAMDAVLKEVMRVLKRGGRFLNMQPNLLYEPARYWDFYDHHLPLSHRSAREGFVKNGFEVEMVVPRFMPYTTKSALPQHPFLVRAYLAIPLAWRVLGGQFLIVGRKP